MIELLGPLMAAFSQHRRPPRKPAPAPAAIAASEACLSILPCIWPALPPTGAPCHDAATGCEPPRVSRGQERAVTAETETSSQLFPSGYAFTVALVVWAVQRLLSKVALQDLGTEQFYLPSAAVSLLTYAPYLALRPLARSELLPAFGLACFMAVTFGVTT